MSLQVDGVDFFTAIFLQGGGFLCWYYTPEGEKAVKEREEKDLHYDVIDFTVAQIETTGLPKPVGYTPPTLPYQDCEVPTYTDEQIIIMNMQKGIDDLLQAIVELPIEAYRDIGVEFPLISLHAVYKLVEQFKKDFQDGKIA